MILVTGAAGLSGSIIVRELVRQRVAARALVRSAARAPWLQQLPGIEVVEADLGRPETLGAALEGVERALLISSANMRMVETQCTFIDACQRAGVGHVVKFSGVEKGIGFDSSRFRFSRMHEEIERYLEGSGLPWTHLRPGQFMQVYLREASRIAAERKLALPMGEGRLSPVDLEDVAKVACAILRDGGHAGSRFDLTGPEALTMAEIAARISDAIGETVRYVDVDPGERRKALAGLGVPAEMLDGLDELFAERRRCRESGIALETHRAFGIRPTPFADFARRNADVFRGRAESQVRQPGT